mmetsp:Transcript_70133/g.195091  ORF Transcript_70133/g.195091 Transcript_70133/m.195091 type:complete len:446 (-) Transcript_70133:58-1395(-)
MGDSIIDKASAALKAAEHLDCTGKLAEAKEQYVRGAELIALELRHSRNERLKPRLRERLRGVIERAEQIKSELEATPRPAAARPSPDLASAAVDATAQDGAAPDALMESLRGSIVSEKPNVPWENVAGMDYAKRVLRDATEFPAQFPHLFRQGRLEPVKGVLLYGPPGTGKTYLAKAVASNSPESCTFLSISSADLVSKWVGESAKLVKTLFTLARRLAPTVVFIDEIDALCSERGAEGAAKSESSAQLLAEFLTQMDGCGPATEGTLILAATNHPWALDRAILSRFQKKIHVALPSAENRAAQLQIELRKDRSVLSEAELGVLGQRTSRFSSRDLASLVQAALAECLEEFQSATMWRRLSPHPFDASLDCAYEPVVGSSSTSAGPVVNIDLAQLRDDARMRTRTVLPAMSLRHFERALTRCKASVSDVDLSRFQEWTDTFGTSA